MAEDTKAKTIRATLAIADALAFYCAIAIVTLMLTGAFRDDQNFSYSLSTTGVVSGDGNRLPVLSRRPCDEIYVVGEGETLHTISDKCGDPFIVEKNPHIHDPDDVFPGLVIKITPSSLGT
ncbi:peptidoglycan-binding LysM domain-containing protein [Artemisia annua]|uniref:Peptidoglycan-binding LysM domain-containing protein n=1 Tax=Artemisia annua TaxID=35608 RepID=A0A2U1LRV0_ARTAN|nr:peptidoglycan-binding LysM domain-containing protein [Artemisia annua]